MAERTKPEHVSQPLLRVLERMREQQNNDEDRQKVHLAKERK